jgi:Retroviral aspartyl protease
MESEGLPTVGVRPAQLLIDTGSSGTCIDIGILDDLENPPSGDTWMHSASTIAPERRCTFDVSLWIEGQDGILHPLMPTVSVVGTTHRHQGLDGLLGRDVLEKCTMNYAGPSKQIFLIF